MLLSNKYPKPSIPLNSQEIILLAGEANYTTVHFVDGSRVSFSRTLKEYETKHPDLVRLDKSLLINPAHVQAWKRVDSRVLWVIIGATKYYASRRRVEEVVRRLQGLNNHPEQ